jgi:hypothetical protein
MKELINDEFTNDLSCQNEVKLRSFSRTHTEYTELHTVCLT